MDYTATEYTDDLKLNYFTESKALKKKQNTIKQGFSTLIFKPFFQGYISKLYCFENVEGTAGYGPFIIASTTCDIHSPGALYGLALDNVFSLKSSVTAFTPWKQNHTMIIKTSNNESGI